MLEASLINEIDWNKVFWLHVHFSSNYFTLNTFFQTHWVSVCELKQTHYFLFPSPSVFNKGSSACELQILTGKKVSGGPKEASLSHRKHCSWNASSVVCLSISWRGDIILCHHVTY